MKISRVSLFLGLIVIALPITAAASSFTFSTGNVTSLMAMASRPDSSGKIEIEAADDFILGARTLLQGGTFTGLLTGATTADIGQIVLEIYRVFPKDSNVGRTSGPPTFSTAQVPTRVNSPADVEFVGRDTVSGGLTVTTSVLSTGFTASNSVLNGINPIPKQTTGGDGAVTGTEVQFSFNLTNPFDLPPDHYFFVPQVEITNGGEFYWLSGTRPIVPPGTPFAPDLQAWMRNADLDPDWLRVGADIVGGTPAPTFNGAFTLTGQVPEPSTLALALLGLTGMMLCKKFRSAV